MPCWLHWKHNAQSHFRQLAVHKSCLLFQNIFHAGVDA
jgi:hypothetical protein